jgi:RecA/RadA recombinase
MANEDEKRGASRDIPWHSVIQFHKEITRRAEEAFFSLPLNQINSERWSSLPGFEPAELSGPWELSLESVRSEGLRHLIRSETIDELYLGCCGFQQSRKTDKGFWVTDWAPVIYRQIDLRIGAEDEIELIPAQGKWELSPLVFSLLDKRNVVPKEPLEEWLPKLMEDASSSWHGNATGLAGAIDDMLSREIPELGEEMHKPFQQVRTPETPTAWVLFTPSNTTSPINRHLMADYEALEELRENLNTNPGGLRLLQDYSNTSSAASVDLLPIVPLDDSQRQAVERILGGQQVTVISGPPGCGKSQVVVSALLNCWAQGTSVLFASNNNKAVDVVRERVERFETDFPIAIRAGARKNSNLEEAIRRALNAVVSKGSTKHNTVTREKQSTLLARKKELQGFIDSRIPQRVDEAIRSSLNAYSTFQEKRQTLQSETEALKTSLAGLGYSIDPSCMEHDLVMPLRTWIGNIATAHSEIKAAQIAITRLEAEISNEASRRNQTAQSVGLDPTKVTNWAWLLSGPGPEGFVVRIDAIRKILSDPIEQKLEKRKWDTACDRWKGSKHASSWLHSASEIVLEIRRSVGEYEQRLTELDHAQSDFLMCRNLIRKIGLSEGIELDPDVLADWAAVWAEECTSPESRFDWLPWSSRSRRLGYLRRLEKILRRAISSSVWTSIGTLDREGRTRLCAIIEDLQKWCAAKRMWQNLDNSRSEIEKTFSEYRGNAGRLQLKDIPNGWEGAAWLSFADAIERDVELAQRASEAWIYREEQESLIQSLRKAADDFESYASGVPIKEAWLQGKGAQFLDAIRTLTQEPCQDTATKARTALYSDESASLISSWQNARDREQHLAVLKADRASINTPDSIVRKWWDGRPKMLRTGFPASSILPASDDPLIVHLEHCSTWCQEWNNFCGVRKPQLETAVNSEEQWAREKLTASMEALPRSLEAIKARQLVDGILKGDVSDWPTDALQAAFATFSPDAIRSRINQCDEQLQALAFSTAQDAWITKLSDDQELQITLEKLLKRYERNKGKIQEDDFPLFRKVLEALPIWITTAQAPQALPLLPELFDLLIIDEATQCTVTNLLPLIYRARRVAVIGDKEQLPAIPTLTSGAEQSLARTCGVDHLLDLLGHTQNTVYNTFIQCLPRRNSDVTNLSEHYRSHPLIIGFSNEHVYRMRLRLRKNPDTGVKVPCGPGMFAQNVDGTCERGSHNQSWVNRAEAKKVVETIAGLRHDSKFIHFSLGVVTPFRAQVELIQEMLDQQDLARGIVIGTAHRFQGDECDIMLFSPVIGRGITDSAATWIEKPHNLINVAVTRAREAFFLVGDLARCRQQEGILGQLAQYVDQVQLLRETSLDELTLFSWMVVQGWCPEIHPVVAEIEVDFVLHNDGKKLAIEVDGSQHKQSITPDASRDAFLKAKGYLTLRVTARDVRETPAGCIEKIDAALFRATD